MTVDIKSQSDFDTKKGMTCNEKIANEKLLKDNLARGNGTVLL